MVTRIYAPGSLGFIGIFIVARDDKSAVTKALGVPAQPLRATARRMIGRCSAAVPVYAISGEAATGVKFLNCVEPLILCL
ncbi:hypothetical protein D3C87_1716040 [compost metagenome]